MENITGYISAKILSFRFGLEDCAAGPKTRGEVDSRSMCPSRRTDQTTYGKLSDNLPVLFTHEDPATSNPGLVP
jgi:hypothetical protein